MDEPQEVFYLTSLDQARTIADTLRVRLLEYLARQPLTVTQLGELVGETPAKVHYHVRELERIGVVRLVETREKGGILEKYYRAVAKSIQVSPDILQSAPRSELAAMLTEWFQWIMHDAIKAANRAVQRPDGSEPLTIENQLVWATNDEFRTLLKEVHEMVKRLGDPRESEGEREWTFSIIAHRIVTGQDGDDTAPSDPIMPVEPALPVPPSPPPVPHVGPAGKRTIVAAGDIRLTRTDLEKAVAEHRPYDISLLGIVRIDEDVSAELADRAISRLRLRGKLIASPEVRAVLANKGQNTLST